MSDELLLLLLLLLLQSTVNVEGRRKEKEKRGRGRGRGRGKLWTNEGRDASTIVRRASTVRGDHLHTSIVIFLISSILLMHISVTFFAASTCATWKQQRK